MKHLSLLFVFLFSAFIFTSNAHAENFDTNYSGYAQVLNNYLKEGFVNYKALKKSSQDLEEFLDSVKFLERSEFDSWDDESKIAFWLNVYNASAMQIVLMNYPIKGGGGFKASFYPKSSIQRIKNVWNKDFIQVFGSKMSLNDIENETLRKNFKEPRIHFALVCASIGCPVLKDEPYIGKKLEAQLTSQTQGFLADSSKNEYKSSESTFYLSPIFKWFGEDFDSAGGPVLFAKKYVSPEIAANLSKDTRIRFLDYDWSLNEKK